MFIFCWLATAFCGEKHARRVEVFFQPRVAALSGGPRNLQGALEELRLCGAKLKAHEADLKALFNDADRALYRAKEAGKDCVVAAEPEGDRADSSDP